MQDPAVGGSSSLEIFIELPSSGSQARRRRRFRLKAVDPAVGVGQRQRAGSILIGAASNLTAQPTFAEVAAADAVRKLLQVREDLLNIPTTAKIVADYRVKCSLRFFPSGAPSRTICSISSTL